MDLKVETDGLDGKFLKKMSFKKMALKMDFECALFKKGIKGNQRAMWKVQVGPRGDTPHSNNLAFTNKLHMK